MVVAATSGWRKQTLTKAQFRAGADRWWPAHVRQQLDPDDAYDICVHYEVDANLVINIFRHESSSGRAGVALQTHSAGNTREPTFGRVRKKVADAADQARFRTASGKQGATYHVSALGVAPGRSGYFAVFETWKDGWESTVARLASPDWVYVGKSDIFSVINTWAPGQDGNDPKSYVADVVRGMNELIALEVTMPPATRLIDMFDHVPQIDTSQVLTAEQIAALPNFPHKGLRRLAGMTWHQTGNPRPGANAQAHRDFVANGGGSERVSYQWTVDSERIIQITPVMVACWHAGDGGDGPGNMETNATELCINSDGDYYRTLYNAAYLGAWLPRNHPVEPGFNRQHNFWSGKNCPQQIRERGEWEWFLQGIADWGAKLDADAGPRTRKVDGVGGAYDVSGAILTAYEALETIGAVWWAIGIPMGPEAGPVVIDDVERRVQPFDRSWLMTEGNGAVIPKPAQLVAIKKQLGIETGTDVRLDELRRLLHGADDYIHAAMSEVAG